MYIIYAILSFLAFSLNWSVFLFLIFILPSSAWRCFFMLADKNLRTLRYLPINACEIMPTKNPLRPESRTRGHEQKLEIELGEKKNLKSRTHVYITPNATMKRMAKRTACTTNMTIIPITMIIAKITENNAEWLSKPHDVRDRYGTWKHPWRIICSAYLWQPVYGAKKCVYI